MDLGFNTTRKFSTIELPYVICEPPLEFEFINAPIFEWSLKFHRWASDDAKDNDLLIDLAAYLLQSVTTAEGKNYLLGSREAIGELIESTSIEFVSTILQGWAMMVAIKRVGDKKKQRKSSGRLTTTNGKKQPAKELSEA